MGGALLLPAAALAAFDAPSIHGTGETLPADRWEVGMPGVAYGLREDLTLFAPLYPAMVGAAGLEARRRFRLGDAWRVTPQVGAGWAFGSARPFAHAGATVGLTLGRHSLALGGRAQRGPGFTFPLGVDTELGATRPHWIVGGFVVELQAEYDVRLWSGGLLYAGATNLLPYWGFTWAFQYVHVGVRGWLHREVFALSLFPFGLWFLPMPYVYARF